MRTAARVSERRGYVARSVPFPTARAQWLASLGADGKFAESCASVLPFAIGSRSLLFREACRPACTTAATPERSFHVLP